MPSTEPRPTDSRAQESTNNASTAIVVTLIALGVVLLLCVVAVAYSLDSVYWPSSRSDVESINSGVNQTIDQEATTQDTANVYPETAEPAQSASK